MLERLLYELLCNFWLKDVTISNMINYFILQMHRFHNKPFFQTTIPCISNKKYNSLNVFVHKYLTVNDTITAIWNRTWGYNIKSVFYYNAPTKAALFIVKIQQKLSQSSIIEEPHYIAIIIQ